MDNTRGQTEINPTVYKGDVMTQAWIDGRILATLSIWLDTEGIMTRFLSEVMRETLEMVVDNLVKDGKIEMIEDTDKAREILRTRYRINLNAKDRAGNKIGNKNIVHNRTLSCRRVESGRVKGHSGYRFTDEHLPVENLPMQSKDDEQPEPEQSKSNRAINDADESEVLKLMEERKDEAARKRMKEEKEKVLANADIDENGVITPHSFDNPKGPIYEEFMEKVEEEQRVIDEAEKEKRKETKAVKKRNKERDRLARRLEELGEDEDEEDVDDSCAVRKRSDEEILAERVRKDKEQKASIEMKLE